MKKKWDLSVRGKGHQVVIDGSASGGDVIRVDGRLAAAPLDADETQRAFFVDGVAYSLRRNGSRDFELMPIGSGPVHSARVEHSDEGNVVAKWLRAIARVFGKR